MQEANNIGARVCRGAEREREGEGLVSNVYSLARNNVGVHAVVGVDGAGVELVGRRVDCQAGRCTQTAPVLVACTAQPDTVAPLTAQL